jgi:hypothetical protein
MSEDIRDVRIAQLKAALRPFAQAADKADEGATRRQNLGMGDMGDSASPGWGIKYKHVKAARFVLLEAEGRGTTADQKYIGPVVAYLSCGDMVRDMAIGISIAQEETLQYFDRQIKAASLGGRTSDLKVLDHIRYELKQALHVWDQGQRAERHAQIAKQWDESAENLRDSASSRQSSAASIRLCIMSSDETAGA